MWLYVYLVLDCVEHCKMETDAFLYMGILQNWCKLLSHNQKTHLKSIYVFKY